MMKKHKGTGIADLKNGSGELDLDKLTQYLEEVWKDRIPEKNNRLGDTSVLKIHEWKDENGHGMSFQIGTLYTGLGGFLNFLSHDPLCYYFSKIFYNDVEMNKEQESHFWKWIDEEMKQRNAKSEEE